MYKESFGIRIGYALQALTWADQILQDVEEADESEPDDDLEKTAPWQAAQSSVTEAMCLLLDSLEGIETVTYSSKMAGPIPRRKQPYSYLSARHAEMADRYEDHARGLEDILRDFDPHD